MVTGVTGNPGASVQIPVAWELDTNNVIIQSQRDKEIVLTTVLSPGRKIYVQGPVLVTVMKTWNVLLVKLITIVIQ